MSGHETDELAAADRRLGYTSWPKTCSSRSEECCSSLYAFAIIFLSVGALPDILHWVLLPVFRHIPMARTIALDTCSLSTAELPSGNGVVDVLFGCTNGSRRCSKLV